MKSSLQLSLNQSLKLTPQLQQAIKLLQLSSSELQELVQEAAQENPFLELDITSPQEVLESSNITQQTKTSLLSSDKFDSFNKDFENIYKTEDSLQSYLTWQVNLIPLSSKDQIIVENIIDSIDEDGYLESHLKAIFEGLQINNPDLDVKFDECEAMLHLVQNLDPIGCGSANMHEALNIQLQRFSKDTPYLNEAINIVSNYLSMVAKQDHEKLMKYTKLSKNALLNTLNLIKSLDPRPGNRFSIPKTKYITPDVIAIKHEGKWHAQLSSNAKPKIKLDQKYIDLMSSQNSEQNDEYTKTHLQDAKWLIRSIKTRNSTLLKVAEFIITYQQDFIENGDISMKPLTLQTIAKSLDLHESTISRVTTEKYLFTPRGIFELKYFLSSHLSTKTGEIVSAKSIQALIKKIIEDEDPIHPLSDIKIREILFEQGINIARRTVTKYREATGISSSNLRRIACKEF